MFKPKSIKIIGWMSYAAKKLFFQLVACLRFVNAVAIPSCTLGMFIAIDSSEISCKIESQSEF